MTRSPRVYRALPRRLRRATVLLAGCGDVGQRIGARLAARGLRAIGTLRNPEHAGALRAKGIVPLRLDLDTRLPRLAAWCGRVIHLAPPPAEGGHDPRTRRLIAALSRPPGGGPSTAGSGGAGGRSGRWPFRHDGGDARSAPGPLAGARWVYISTTGVYGDCAGAQFDETRTVAPANPRAQRRVAAEGLWRAAARRGARASVLRVPGIYAHDRLPLARLRQGLPALQAQDDVFTNHIHADDLARIGLAALWRGRPGRVVHAVDDSDLRMGEYFDLVADAAGLPRPPRVPAAELAARVSPMMLSFMSESRRLRNRRLKQELRLRLRYPTVAHTLAEAFGPVLESSPSSARPV